jgi:hypothetical protein
MFNKINSKGNILIIILDIIFVIAVVVIALFLMSSAK